MVKGKNYNILFICFITSISILSIILSCLVFKNSNEYLMLYPTATWDSTDPPSNTSVVCLDAARGYCPSHINTCNPDEASGMLHKCINRAQANSAYIFSPSSGNEYCLNNRCGCCCCDKAGNDLSTPYSELNQTNRDGAGEYLCADGPGETNGGLLPAECPDGSKPNCSKKTCNSNKP